MRLIFYAAFFIIVTFSCGRVVFDHGEGKTTQVNQSSGKDTVVESVIGHYKISLDSIMNEVIGFNDKTLEKDQPEGALGNFVCDLIWQAMDTLVPDSLKPYPMMVLMNNGGLRASLPAGKVTVGDVYRVMPFDNKMVVVKVDGEHMNCLLRFIVTKGGMPVGGVRIGIHDTIPGTVIFGSEQFDRKKNYLVATSDYLANGGDNITCFAGSRWNSGKFVRELIIGHYRLLQRQHKIVSVSKDRRIAYE